MLYLLSKADKRKYSYIISNADGCHQPEGRREIFNITETNHFARLTTFLQYAIGSFVQISENKGTY